MSSRAIAVVSLVLAVVFALVAGVMTVGLVMEQNESAVLRERMEAIDHENRRSLEALRWQQMHNRRLLDKAQVAGAEAENSAVDPLILQSAETLLDRIDARLDLMTDVARWKWNEKQPIDDPDRERQLLERIVAQARERGIDADFAAAFFRDQVEAAKWLQRALFASWKEQGTGSFHDVPDLKSDQRPKIDDATNALLDALAAIEPRRRDPEFQAAFAAAVRKRSQFVPARADRWVRTVLSLLPDEASQDALE